MTTFWDERYSEEGYAYGDTPNVFVATTLESMKAGGSVLFPAEGEGRNALFAAQLGWEAFAYDISEQGRFKAMELAAQRGVRLEYRIGSFTDIAYDKGTFDGLVLSYVHMPSSLKKGFFEKHLRFLKTGAFVIIEVFSEQNLSFKKHNPTIGGPDDLDMLYSAKELQGYLNVFGDFKIWEEEVELHEGKYHIGKGSVVRCFGRVF
jgi:SAM-dependent methyltransferase